MGDMDMLRGAQWLSGPDFDYGVDSAGYYEPVHRTHVVSRSFRLTAEEAEGLQLTIAVLGYAKLHVNGEPLPRVELLGHWTRWDRAVYTDTFDVTGLVRAGENRISIELGNGFYNPSPLTLFGKYNLRDRLAEVGTPQVLCALHAGGAPVLVSDASWACAEGELLFNNVYLGEVRDLRPAHAGALSISSLARTIGPSCPTPLRCAWTRAPSRRSPCAMRATASSSISARLSPVSSTSLSMRPMVMSWCCATPRASTRAR